MRSRTELRPAWLELTRGYAYQVLIDVAQPWKLPVPLVQGIGNFGGRGNDPPELTLELFYPADEAAEEWLRGTPRSLGAGAR